MRRLGKGRRRLFRGQRGFSLLEVLVAVGIMGFIGAAVIMALDTNYRADRTLDEQVTGVNLATAYFEAIRALPYDNTNHDEYSSANITTPPGYDVGIDADYSDDGTSWVDSDNRTDEKLQRITISVSREGGKPVFSTCTYRMER